MTDTNIPRLLYRGELQDDSYIRSLTQSPYAASLLLAFSALRTDILYQSRIHGQMHIERVLTLGAIIASLERFTARETKLALFACSYHDIGRINDHYDDMHGTRSADMLEGKGLVSAFGELDGKELAAVKAAVATHSTHDSALPEKMAKYGVGSDTEALCLKICRCLKDADNLDRVRIGDLDPSYLRFEHSKALVPTAQLLFDRTKTF